MTTKTMGPPKSLKVLCYKFLIVPTNLLMSLNLPGDCAALLTFAYPKREIRCQSVMIENALTEKNTSVVETLFEMDKPDINYFLEKGINEMNVNLVHLLFQKFPLECLEQRFPVTNNNNVVRRVSALGYAVKERKDQMIVPLIQMGEDVNFRLGNMYPYCLACAAFGFRVQVVQILLVHGAIVPPDFPEYLEKNSKPRSNRQIHGKNRIMKLLDAWIQENRVAGNH